MAEIEQQQLAAMELFVAGELAVAEEPRRKRRRRSEVRGSNLATPRLFV